jgi:PAS domain S-box-containing protein
MLNHLKEEVQTQLEQLVDKEANVIEQQIQSITYTTEMYRLQTAAALKTAAVISSQDQERLAYSEKGAYYTTKDSAEGSAAIYYSGIMPIGMGERAKVGRVLTMQMLMKDIIKSQPLAASIYFNSFDSLNIIYPYFDVISQYPPLMNIPTYNFYYEADSAHNPERKVRWTDAYLDPAGQGWMSSSIAPVYNGDFLEGVVGIDVTINNFINQILNLNIPWQGYGVLVGKDGAILALPEKGEQDWGLQELTNHHYNEAILKDTFKPDRFNIYQRTDMALLAKQVSENNNGFTGNTLNQNQQVVAWATVPETGWKLLIVVPEKNIYAQVNQMSQELLRIGILMIAGLIIFYLIFFSLLTKRAHKMSCNISQPLLEINNMVQKIGSGEYYQPDPNYFVKELQETAATLVKMGQELGTTNESLLTTQAKLKKRESDLQALMDSIDDVILEVDENGVFLNVWANEQNILNRPVKEIIGSSFESIMDLESAGLHKSLIKRVLETKQPESVEYLMETPRGFRWFQARISRIANDSKTVSLSARDITERKEMEKSIITAKEEAEKASQAKSQFLSNMSHELRTPLNAILGFAQLLQIDPAVPLNESQEQNVQEIIKAGNHLVVLINEVLDLAKIESGKFSITVEPVQLNLIMEETQALIQPLADKKKIKIITGNTTGLDLFVLADRTRLKQVLLNLLSNAIKFNRENGEVKFFCEQEDKIIRINVKDNGYGIPGRELDAIFDPFYRVSHTSNIVEGTGIGLAVAKQLMELMGGGIGVDSEVGIGSHFRIELQTAEKTT